MPDSDDTNQNHSGNDNNDSAANRSSSPRRAAPPLTTTTTPSRVGRPSKLRPIIKLSVNLLDTYNIINKRYYQAKRARQEERRRNRERKKRAKGGHGSAIDDKDYNYIVKESELLNGRYVVNESIGKGSFGKVVRALDTDNDKWVAIKIVKSKPPFLKQAQIEISILSSLQRGAADWNIVQMTDQFMHHNHQCIVFELLSINLFELLVNTKFRGIALSYVERFAKQLLKTLSYLDTPRGPRGQKVIHCDLKPENILLRHKSKPVIKVIDFGSACFSDQKMYSYIQSRFYRAPEVLLGLRYDNAIDMWSLGCILVEMYTGKPLFDGNNEVDQMVKQVEILGIPPAKMLEDGRKTSKFFKYDDKEQKWKLNSYLGYRPDRSLDRVFASKTGSRSIGTPRAKLFQQLVERMLEFEPDKRIKPQEALSHPFITRSSSSRSSTYTQNSSSGSSSSLSPASSSSTTAMATSITAVQHDTKMEEAVGKSKGTVQQAWGSHQDDHPGNTSGNAVKRRKSENMTSGSERDVDMQTRLTAANETPRSSAHVHSMNTRVNSNTIMSNTTNATPMETDGTGTSQQHDSLHVVDIENDRKVAAVQEENATDDSPSPNTNANIYAFPRTHPLASSQQYPQYDRPKSQPHLRSYSSSSSSQFEFAESHSAVNDSSPPISGSSSSPSSHAPIVRSNRLGMAQNASGTPSSYNSVGARIQARLRDPYGGFPNQHQQASSPTTSSHRYNTRRQVGQQNNRAVHGMSQTLSASSAASSTSSSVPMATTSTSLDVSTDRYDDHSTDQDDDVEMSVEPDEFDCIGRRTRSRIQPGSSTNQTNKKSWRTRSSQKRSGTSRAY